MVDFPCGVTLQGRCPSEIDFFKNLDKVHVVIAGGATRPAGGPATLFAPPPSTNPHGKTSWSVFALKIPWRG